MYNPNKGLYGSVCSSSVWNSQKLETAQMSVNRKMENHIVVEPHVGCHAAIKRSELSVIHMTAGVTQPHGAEWKKPDKGVRAL